VKNAGRRPEILAVFKSFCSTICPGGNWAPEECLSGNVKEMKKENRKYYIVVPALTLLLSVGAVFCCISAEKPVVPVVDGHLGSCSAEFTVMDKDQTPLYDAKIDVSLRYGFLGLRRMSLQVGTNGEGQARVEGLPDDLDKTFRFVITSGSMTKKVLMNTSDGCDAAFKVVLIEE
jgi:hypothetical protein